MNKAWFYCMVFYSLAGCFFIAQFKFELLRVKKRYLKESIATHFINDHYFHLMGVHPPRRLKFKDIAFFILVFLFWFFFALLLFFDLLKNMESNNSYFDEEKIKTTLLNGCWPEHLKELVDIKIVESNSYIFDPLGLVPPLPFGFLNANWKTLLSKIQEDDQFRHYVIEPGQRYGKYGFRNSKTRQGYAILRAGVVVEQFESKTRN